MILCWQQLPWHQNHTLQQGIGKINEDLFLKKTRFSDIISPTSGPKNNKYYTAKELYIFEAKRKQKKPKDA